MSSRPEAGVEVLLAAAAAAHHEAFRDMGGVDSEWPLWYATYLINRLPDVTGYKGTRSELVYRLVQLEREHREGAQDVPWHRFYATRLAAL